MEEIEKKVGSRYALTVLAGKRARQLRDGAPQLVNTDSNNPILVALQEIYEGKIVAENLDYTAAELAAMSPGVGDGPGEAEALTADDLAELADADATGIALPGAADITGEPVQPSEPESGADSDAEVTGAAAADVEAEAEPEAEEPAEVEEPEQAEEAEEAEEVEVEEVEESGHDDAEEAAEAAEDAAEVEVSADEE